MAVNRPGLLHLVEPSHLSAVEKDRIGWYFSDMKNYEEEFQKAMRYGHRPPMQPKYRQFHKLEKKSYPVEVELPNYGNSYSNIFPFLEETAKEFKIHRVSIVGPRRIKIHFARHTEAAMWKLMN